VNRWHVLGFHGGWGGHLHSLGVFAFRYPLFYKVVGVLSRVRSELELTKSRKTSSSDANEVQEMIDKAVWVVCDYTVQKNTPAYLRDTLETKMETENANIRGFAAT